MGRDGGSPGSSGRSGVSIHAPAWGATPGLGSSPNGSSSFNPRARVGRDQRFRQVVEQRFEFQSTRPRGARRGMCCGKYWRHTVSIHAPAWGATEVDRIFLVGRQFQSTRPRGARPQIALVTANGLTFQSTRPRGARLLGRTEAIGEAARFNPRARVGRDVAKRGIRAYTEVSIHAPAWGATAPLPEGGLVLMFQSTRPRGARRLPLWTQKRFPSVSIHAPAWGATPASSSWHNPSSVSIHAPAWGAT